MFYCEKMSKIAESKFTPSPKSLLVFTVDLYSLYTLLIESEENRTSARSLRS